MNNPDLGHADEVRDFSDGRERPLKSHLYGFEPPGKATFFPGRRFLPAKVERTKSTIKIRQNTRLLPKFQRDT
ncbi:hypothetical protein TNCV_4427201 [Trichonephila clavipes]|nr:hypothetical protein TNCV_4427201 [Trichonephila clavipes]